MTLKNLLCYTILLLLAAPVLAQDADPLHEHFFHPELVMMHQRDLKLTAMQREAIQTAVHEAQATFTDAQWQLHAEMQAMEELIQGNEVDETQAMEQLETILNIEREIKQAQLMLMVRIKNTLTPDQQRNLKTARQETPHDDGLWPW